MSETSASQETRSRSSTSTATTVASRPSPYLLLLYPLILAAGSVFATISPVASPTGQQSLAPGTTSDQTTPNYFAGKRNLVNTLFVKRGWFWTTLAFALLQFTTRTSTSNTSKRSSTTGGSPSDPSWIRIQSFIRYVLVTLSWVLVTQWFFGPALVDRSFTLTGGSCEGLPASFTSPPSSKTLSSAAKVATLYSSTACKAVGGRWRGGHDISGHVFMLILSSAFLIYELHLADRHSAHPSVSPRAAVSVAHDMTEEEKRAVGGWESEGMAKGRIYARWFIYAVVGLDLWMLMMTAIWFHTWLEKLNGMFIAALSLWGTYFLGDFVPAWREVVGGL